MFSKWKKSGKTILSGILKSGGKCILKLLEDKLKPSQKGSRTVNSPPLVLGEWSHKDAWIPYVILFNPTRHTNSEMWGGESHPWNHVKFV